MTTAIQSALALIASLFGLVLICVTVAIASDVGHAAIAFLGERSPLVWR